MRRRETRSRIVGALLAIGVLVPLLVGCPGRECDGDVMDYGSAPGQGELTDQDTWESNPPSGNWLEFPGERAWILHIAALGDRVPAATYLPYISADPHGQGSFTLASGNLTIFTQTGPGLLVVKNDTCAEYFLRVVVQAPHLSSDASDSGIADADAVTDAPSDSSIDAHD